MTAKQTGIMHYDQQGNLHIKIPRDVLKKFETSVLFQVVNDLQKNEKMKRQACWKEDSIMRIIGMSNSGISDGAENHDLYLYGDLK